MAKEIRIIEAKDVATLDQWRRIGTISGAGWLPRNPDGTTAIDVTGLSADKLAEIDAVLAEGKGSKKAAGDSSADTTAAADTNTAKELKK